MAAQITIRIRMSPAPVLRLADVTWEGGSVALRASNRVPASAADGAGKFIREVCQNHPHFLSRPGIHYRCKDNETTRTVLAQRPIPGDEFRIMRTFSAR